MDKSWNAPKTKQLNIRLTEYEYECLFKSAVASKMNISHWLRAIIHQLFDELEEKEDKA